MGIRNFNQSGIAAVAVILVIVVVLGVGGAGYYVMTKDKDSSSDSTSISRADQKAIEAECKKEIDDKDFCKFASNFTLGGEYRMTFTNFGEDTGTFVVETDSDGNTYSKASSDGQSVEYVQYNGATYTREEGSEVWLKFPASTDGSSDAGLEDITIDESDFGDFDTVQYENEGKEACGDLTCFKYRIIDDTSPEVSQYLYFDDKEYKLRKFTVIENGQVTTEGTIEYVDVTISEPSPYEEFSIGEFDFDDLQNFNLDN